MIITKPSKEMIEEWKKIFTEHHLKLKPNRKTGIEVNEYFKSKYAYEELNNLGFKRVVELNILENEYRHAKLPNGLLPNIQCYRVEDVYIGIDVSSGEFYTESKNIKNCIPIYDDLFLFRGLDEMDLQNFYLVGEYIQLMETEVGRAKR